MDADFQLLGRVPVSLTRFTIEIDERTEAVRPATNDRDHQRKSERAGTRERLWSSADSEPDRKRILERPRIHSLPCEYRPMLARPGDVLVIADLEQQVELLGEQRVVILEPVAE